MADLIGSRLAQFRIDSLIGEGGMGSVYRGWDTSLSRPVAIKVMHAQFGKQSEFRRRFLQEAQAPARLSHPSIVHVYNFGSQDGLLYLVMEYVPGATLSSYLRRTVEDNHVVHLKETLVILAQAADALDYAHRNGVIHRDVKPDNILLRRLDHADREGDPPLRATLTDFGLAKLLEGGVETQTGAFFGTLAYMSPEQCFGQHLDGRSDVYSLGVVLYRLTTGRLPLDIQSPTDAILKHQQVTPPAPRELRPGIPIAVEKIIQKAIQKEPEDRYQAAGALYRDLRHAADQISEVDLNEFASTELVLSMATLPEKAEENPPERPALLDKAVLPVQGEGEDRIHIMAPEKTIRSVLVQSRSLLVGRGEDCDVQIDDPMVSHHHARIDFEGEDVWIVDLKSTNGTFIENVRLLEGVREKWNPDKLVRTGNSWMRLERIVKEPSSFPSEVPDAIPERSAALSEYSSTGGRIAILLAQEEFILPPGSGVAIPVLIFNQGNVVDHFRLTLRDLPPEWPAAIPAVIRLMPMEQGEATIRLPAPPDGLTAGVYQARVCVAGEISPEETAVAEIAVRISPRYACELALHPNRRRALSEGQFTVEVHNSGNTALDLQLSGEDPEGACTFAFSPNPVSVPAWQTARVNLIVRSALGVRDWSGKSHPFTIRSHPAGEVVAPAMVQGTWEQAPPEFEIHVEPAVQRGFRSARFSVLLTSYSSETCDLQLQAYDPAGRCSYAFSPQRVNVGAGQNAQAALTVTAARGALTQRVDFTVRAQLAEASHLTKEVQAAWEPIQPRIALMIDPARQRSSRGAVFKLKVRGESDADLDLEFTAAGDERVHATLQQTRLMLPARAARTIELEIVPRGAGFMGSEQIHVVEVAARLAGEPEVLQRVSAEWVQEMDLPEQVTIADASSPGRPASLPEDVGRGRGGSRWVPGCLALLVSLAVTVGAGMLAGSTFYDVFDQSDTGSVICASAVWLIGLWLSIRIFNRVRKPPGR